MGSFPLAAHYGTNVVGLTLDEGGIPDTAEARFAIAEAHRGRGRPLRHRTGPHPHRLPGHDRLDQPAPSRADPACHVSVQGAPGRQMRARRVEHQLYSPARPLLGSVFWPQLFGAGLDAPIMNPGSKRFMDTVYSYRVLSVEDEGSTGYIERYAGWTDPVQDRRQPGSGSGRIE